MSKLFCCCIPVRFGVFIMSLTMLLGWGALSVLVFAALAAITKDASKFPQYQSTGTKVGFGISGAVYIVFALVSLFGLVGAIARRRKFVATYSGLMWLTFFINLVVSGGAVISVIIAKVKGSDGNLCQTAQNLTDEERQSCVKLFQDATKTAFVVAFCLTVVFLLLWHLYGCIIVKRYVQQLEDEDLYSKRSNGGAATVNVSVGGNTGYYPYGSDYKPGSYGSSSRV